MRNFSLFAALFLFSLTFYACQNFDQNIARDTSGNLFTDNVDSIVISKMNEYNIPGLSIGLVANDSIIYTRGYGIKSIDHHDPVTETTNFHTASISKLLTAQAVMMLIERNIFSLDDRLLSIIPELQYSDERVEDITIEHLLNHTAGLPDVSDYHWESTNQSDESLKNYILDLDLTLEFEPSTQYAYSNIGYNLLGYAIEKRTDTSFDIYLKENILNPSGMMFSDFRYFKIPDSLKSSPHSKNKITQKIYVRKTYPYTREHAPSSTLNSSARDLSRWMISMLQKMDNHTTENVYYLMTKPSATTYPYIGLGFQLGRLESLQTVGHFGGDKGYRSYLLMIPEEKIGLVVLANCDYSEEFREEIIHPIAKLMLLQNQKP